MHDLAAQRWGTVSGKSTIRGVLIAVLLSGCGAVEEPVEVEETPLPSIVADTFSVEFKSWPQVVRSQGSLVADEVTVLGAKVAGRVAEVHVDLGDHVEADQPLVSLDLEEFRLHVQQAEAQLLQARSAVGLQADQSTDELDPSNAAPVREERAVWDEASASLQRADRLKSENAISELEYDQLVAAERVAEARYASAVNGVRERLAMIEVKEAELSLARQRLRDAVVRASFDGVIQERQVSPGTFVQVGDPAVTVVRTSLLRFQGMIPERYAQRLRLGQDVVLEIESIAEPRRVQVSRISPALDRVTRSLLFEAEVSNAGASLRAGLFAEAEIVVDPESQAIVIPRSAIVEFAGSEKVWQVVGDVAHETEIITGERREAGIEVLSGLEPGDVLLLDGARGKAARIQAPMDST